MRRANSLRLGIVAVLGLLILLAANDVAAQYKGLAVKKGKLINVLRSRQLPTREIVAVINTNGVDFQVTPAVEDELVRAGARPEIITAANANYREPPRRRTVVATPREVASEDYDRLYYQGFETLNQLRAATSVDQASRILRSVIETGNQAIKADPTRPDAYKLVATAYILLRNFAEAERNCQLAVDRGGSLAFPVYHLSGPPHVEILFVGKGFVTVESNQKLFQFNGREMSNLRSEDDYLLSGTRVAVFSMQTYKDGRADTWYFTPGNTGTSQEANMIIKLISSNSIDGK